MAECKARLMIDKRRYPCDVEAPHPGLAHGNVEVGAHWISDGEARSELRRAKNG